VQHLRHAAADLSSHTRPGHSGLPTLPQECRACNPEDTPGEDKHLLAQFIIQNFTGMYKAMILLVTKFREALYREVCLLHQNLPEG